MGQEIAREAFSQEDHARFRKRLEQGLEVLRRLVARPDFGVGPRSVGVELELSLIDARGAPLPVNQAVLQETLDPRFTFELNRFNLECNLHPTPLEGRPFAALQEQLSEALSELARAAAVHSGRIVSIGILPTLRAEHLRASAMTDSARYRVLAAALRRIRARPFALRIEGQDALAIDTEDITFEGAATSLQLHIRVSPGEFDAAFNAAQLATAPALAVACNSPIFLGRQLWEETRIALFRQAADDRTHAEQLQHAPPRVGFGERWIDGGAVELFESANAYEVLLPQVGAEDPMEALRAGATPRLDELRLHQGTVWSWNRPVYDPAGRGHLRIELRALPAGPSVCDMLANMAFLVGLTYALKSSAHVWTRRLSFEAAEQNFYRAAQRGLEARLWWFGASDEAEPRLVPATVLVQELLPLARAGLESAGVEPSDSAPWLDIIRARCSSAQTGASWQRATLRALETQGLSRAAALAILLARYTEQVEADRPVHTWPIEAYERGPQKAHA